MSIFATAAIVCTMATCNTYHADVSTVSFDDGVKNTNALAQEFMGVMSDEHELNKWLEKYQIGETVFEIVSIDFETHEVQEDDAP